MLPLVSLFDVSILRRTESFRVFQLVGGNLQIYIARSLVILLVMMGAVAGTANVAQAAPYGYNYNYTIQSKDSARRSCAGTGGNSVWKSINPILGRLFPVGGMPNNIKAGQTVTLMGGNKIYIEQVGTRHFQFKALPGHLMGAGNHLKFTISEDGKTLNTYAWGDGGDSNALLKWVKTAVPSGLWYMFGLNLYQQLCPILGPRALPVDLSETQAPDDVSDLALLPE